MTHYHVSRHTEDDDVFVTDDLFAALDYAADELDRMADFEHDGVSMVAAKIEEESDYGTPGNVYDMREALLSFAKMERYNTLMLNARNLVKQSKAAIAERAPFYTPDWEEGGEDAAQARLSESAKRTAGEINSGSPIRIWDCDAELRTWPDNDQMHGGESYCADEYPDGYAENVALNTQDGPCGDL